MRVLVLGSDGFFGRNIVAALAGSHEVIKGTRRPDVSEGQHYIELSKPDNIVAALNELQPDAIVNNAGVVENSDKALMNPVMTTNLLEAVVKIGLQPKRIIIYGSAAEYGIVTEKDIPVKEDTPLNPFTTYGKSKVQETAASLKFRKVYNLPVTIARIFNPIGVGMGPRFLISGVLRQFHGIKAGTREAIEVSRLDAKRDYCHILDAAQAVKLLIEGQPKEAIYNISSGVSTSNGEIIELILAYSKLEQRPDIIETAPEPEPLLATQADISRIREEFGWETKRSVEETVQEIIDAEKQ
ncbi:GDP-mannose 4,6-dehydratase [Candidatus Saccharibacteria bacterium]|nr:GDP-mannose 4,6-dehydratase [Candidatus Saccharibacteria bacterium]